MQIHTHTLTRLTHSTGMGHTLWPNCVPTNIARHTKNELQISLLHIPNNNSHFTMDEPPQVQTHTLHLTVSTPSAPPDITKCFVTFGKYCTHLLKAGPTHSVVRQE